MGPVGGGYEQDLEGAPLHAHWVEVDARDQDCYYADRNNPVWQEHLKAVVRLQIDAGAGAISSTRRTPTARRRSRRTLDSIRYTKYCDVAHTTHSLETPPHPRRSPYDKP